MSLREATPSLADRAAKFRAPGSPSDASAILESFLDWVTSTGLEPYPAQEEALLELALDRHVILSTPTGSGKSLVAMGLHFRALCEGKRSFYTAPIKALVSERFFDFCEKFGPENVGMLTGDASINWAAPVICCTAEVLANMALQHGENLDGPHVVMDEFHYYGDRDRGMAWQLPLLIQRQTQFLLMSATLGNTATVEERLHERTGREVTRVHSDERPVPLDFDYREKPILSTIEKLVEERRSPVYVVHFTQREAAEQAQALTSSRLADREQRRRIGERMGPARFDTPYGPTVRRMLGHGIGIHHAGLLPKYRLLVEQLAQEGLLQVVCGTDTLGMGVNIPIRTVLFSKLSKYDGEKVRVLGVRDFKQISGRAGRKGFDDRGSVVCQAPEHVIENLDNERKARRKGGGKARRVKKKSPPRGFVGWNAETFNRLIHSPPETLGSRFRIDHGVLIRCLQSDFADKIPGAGYRRLAELVSACHETPRRKKQLLREAAVLFRALRRAEVVELVHENRAEPGIRVHDDLQQDFSLHRTLSLYLVEASATLDPEAPDHALDILSLVEAILEDPRAILQQQLRMARKELLAELKAQRVPFEERIARLDEVALPKPNSEFIYATYGIFVENHPWVGSENIRPKSIAREMVESYASFHDTVRRFELARMEGLLLRYLGQVHNTLVQTVPTAVHTDALVELIAYFRTMIQRVDSSLVEEWESRREPRTETPSPSDGESPASAPPFDERALQARARAELHQLVRALADRDYEEAMAWMHPGDPAEWDAQRMEAVLAPFYEEYERIRFDPSARQAHRTVFRARGPGAWDVHHVLVDDRDDNDWNIEGEIRIDGSREPETPLVRIRHIGT
ncbi:MAG: DUF3516 domain-containing protein [Myxococcota bacterium]|nr:DUF3516 domain-containing protein [Myxococcota bacterium]